jgi:hypothetical protein
METHRVITVDTTGLPTRTELQEIIARAKKHKHDAPVLTQEDRDIIYHMEGRGLIKRRLLGIVELTKIGEQVYKEIEQPMDWHMEYLRPAQTIEFMRELTKRGVPNSSIKILANILLYQHTEKITL